jgi:hypothetical protein
MNVAQLSPLRTGLNALFARLSGLPTSVTKPKSAGTVYAMGPDMTRLVWQVTDIDSIGMDELRTEYDPDLEIEGDTYEPDPEDPGARLGGVVYTACGPRSYTIELRVECENQDVEARPFLQRVRDKISLPSAQRELYALGLGFREAGPILDASFDDDDGRTVSVYVCELFFNAAASVDDDPVTTIESIQLIEDPVT